MNEDAQDVESTESTSDPVDITNVAHGTQEWYELMAKVMKRRERAVASIKRWEDTLADTEADIAFLTGTLAAE